MNDRDYRTCEVEDPVSALGDFPYDPSKKPLFLNGSGFVHHLTTGFLGVVSRYHKTPFGVVVFDDHDDGVDSQPDDVGDILDPKPEKIYCGLFWFKALKDVPNLKEVVCPEETRARILSLLKNEQDPKVNLLTQDNQVVPKIRTRLRSLPYKHLGVYLSVDLDCLETKYVQTDFPPDDPECNQRMTPELLIERLQGIASDFPVIGADICGLKRTGVNNRSCENFSRVYTCLEQILSA
jgi:arginase family enzyme